jgi:hypothetical protein
VKFPPRLFENAALRGRKEFIMDTHLTGILILVLLIAFGVFTCIRDNRKCRKCMEAKQDAAEPVNYINFAGSDKDAVKKAVKLGGNELRRITRGKSVIDK